MPLKTYAIYTRCEHCGVYDRHPEWCELCGRPKDSRRAGPTQPPREARIDEQPRLAGIRR